MSGRRNFISVGLTCVVIAFPWSGSRAAPQQFNCTLTDTATQPAVESRPVVVIFDDAANSLKAQSGDQPYVFHDVSISSVSISGHADDISLGIDRSSRGIVLQIYGGAGKAAAIEFGRCQSADSMTDRAKASDGR